ncbi:MAG: phage portal protein [Terrimicrobiaceae bacterium]
MNRALTIARDFVARSFGLSELSRAFTTGQDLSGGTAANLTEAYRQSVWVMSALNQVVQPIKTVDLKFYVGDKEIQDSALEEFWSRPALGCTREAWIEATCGWYKLRGEFFWILDDTWLTRSKRKSRFIVARPDDIREVVRGGELLGWVWRDASRRQVELLPEQVIHQKRWNPYNAFRGLAELDAAKLAAETDYAAGRYARDVFRNAGDGGAYVTAKGGVPSDAQQEQIIAALRAKRAARLRGDFQPIFLSGDMDIKDPSVATPDAAFVANRITNRHEIYIAFGVPASMADIQASYSIGSASDFFRLILNTCMPLATTVGGAIDMLLERMDGRAGIESYFEWDEHPVMQAVRSERVDAAQKLWGMGVPLAVASDYLDMGLPAFPGWEKGYLPFSVSETGTVADPVVDPTLTEPTTDPTQEMLRVLKCGHAPLICAKASQDQGRVNLWKSHMTARRATVKAFESKFSRAIGEARRETLAKLEAASGKSTKAVAADIIFDLAKWKEVLVGSMRKVGLSAMSGAVKALLAEIGQEDDVWSMPPADALRFLSERENLMSNIADEIHAEIEETIQVGLIQGDSINDIAASVRERFNGISRERSLRIAQTETSAAYGFSRDEAMKGAGVQYKQWLTSGNENVRDSHRAAERQTVGINEPFDVGGVGLMYPGDPSGPPEEIINCHCVQIAVLNPE